MNHTINNRNGRTNLKEFERELLDRGLLRIGKIKPSTIEGMSIEEFLINFITKWNINTASYPIISNAYTVYNLNGTKQCKKGAYRSSGDMFRICKYYYPNCNFKQVSKIIAKLPTKARINSSICGTIHKRVYSYAGATTYAQVGMIGSQDSKDEFGRKPADYSKLK